MLNKICKQRHACIVPYLQGSAFSFSPLSMILGVGLSYMSYIMLRTILFMPLFYRVFLSYMEIEFCKNLFLYLLR